MAILGRLKRSRVDEDEDEEIDDDDEDDVNDDDDEEAGGGGLTGKLGKLRGLGKMSGVGGMLGKVMKRGSEDDDEDEDDDDDDDYSSSLSVAPAAALDLSENTGIADSAVEPGSEAGSDAPVSLGRGSRRAASRAVPPGSQRSLGPGSRTPALERYGNADPGSADPNRKARTRSSHPPRGALH